MPYFLKAFLLIVFSITIVLTFLGAIATKRVEEDMDSQYYNADGDHIYYERSLIEKKLYQKHFPQISLRKFSSLFGRKGI